jgi:hypothetical protein
MLRKEVFRFLAHARIEKENRFTAWDRFSFQVSPLNQPCQRFLSGGDTAPHDVSQQAPLRDSIEGVGCFRIAEKITENIARYFLLRSASSIAQEISQPLRLREHVECQGDSS